MSSATARVWRRHALKLIVPVIPNCAEHATNYADSDADQPSSSKRPPKGGRNSAPTKAGDAAADANASTSQRRRNVGAGGGGIPDTDDDSNSGPGPKFMDTINPLLRFTTDDLADMNQEFDQFFESDDDTSSNEDEPTDMGKGAFLVHARDTIMQ